MAPAPRGQPLTGGGAHFPPAPLHLPGARLSCGPSPSGPPLFSLPSPRRVVPFWGGGGGVLGVAVRVSG